MPRLGKRLPGSSANLTAEWTAEADAVTLPRLDEVGGHPRPADLGVTYVEHEFGALADEQELTWPAEGEAAARKFRVRARGLDPGAAATDFLLGESEQAVRHAHADYQHASRVLASYERREAFGKARYWVCWPVLWLGDTAGVWAAAVTNGDVPYIAFGQAFAAGLAAACAGLIGAELRDIRAAKSRRRDPETLSEDEKRYSRLFTGASGGRGILALIGAVSLLVVALLAVGIYSLRRAIEGDASGLTFGLLAAATALASGLLAYSAADEVADLLARLGKRVRKAQKRHLRLARSSAIVRRGQAEEMARSLSAEHHLRGQAAGRRVDSLSWRVHRRNPQVLGHGHAPGEPGVVGRRMRRRGQA